MLLGFGLVSDGCRASGRYQFPCLTSVPWPFKYSHINLLLVICRDTTKLDLNVELNLTYVQEFFEVDLATGILIKGAKDVLVEGTSLAIWEEGLVNIQELVPTQLTQWTILL